MSCWCGIVVNHSYFPIPLGKYSQVLRYTAGDTAHQSDYLGKIGIFTFQLVIPNYRRMYLWIKEDCVEKCAVIPFDQPNWRNLLKFNISVVHSLSRIVDSNTGVGSQCTHKVYFAVVSSKCLIFRFLPSLATYNWVLLPNSRRSHKKAVNYGDDGGIRTLDVYRA